MNLIKKEIEEIADYLGDKRESTDDSQYLALFMLLTIEDLNRLSKQLEKTKFIQLLTLDGEPNGVWMGSGDFEKAKRNINERYDNDHDTEPHIIVEQEMEKHGFVRVFLEEENLNINF